MHAAWVLRAAVHWAHASPRVASLLGLSAPDNRATHARSRALRTRRAISAHKNSLQSRLSSIFTEPLPPQPLYARDAFLERERGQIAPVHLLGLAKASRHAEDTLDHGADYSSERAGDGEVATCSRNDVRTSPHHMPCMR